MFGSSLTLCDLLWSRLDFFFFFLQSFANKAPVSAFECLIPTEHYSAVERDQTGLEILIQSMDGLSGSNDVASFVQ